MPPLEGFDDIQLPGEVLYQPNFGGRPIADINLKTVEQAASIGCTIEEVAALTGVCRATIFNHMRDDPAMKEAFERGKEKGRATLRRMQWQGAQDGSAAMLIWLGKQLLGQRDTSALQHLDKEGNPTDPPVPVVNLTISRE